MSTTYLITSIFLVIVLMTILVSIRQRLVRGGDNWVVSQVLVGMTVLYVVMDCLWLMEYLSENGFRIVEFTILNLLFYLTYITLPLAWFFFSMHFLKIFRDRRPFYAICTIPWLVNVVLIIATMLGTGSLWTLKDTTTIVERYTRGPLFGAFSKICLFYYFLPMLLSLWCIVRAADNKERRSLAQVLLFAAVPAIAVFVYTYFIPSEAVMPFQPFCFTLGTLYAYVFLINQAEKKESARYLAVINGLASDYQNVYEVNLAADTLIIFQLSNRIKDLFGEEAFHDMTYSEAATSYVDRAVFPEDREMMHKAFEPESVKELLKGVRSFTKVYRNE